MKSTVSYIRECPLQQSTSRHSKDPVSFKRLPKSSAVKVIDFGSTTYDDQQDHKYIVSTRHYRAPEVILRRSTDPDTRTWNSLAMMERAMGPIPQHMLKRADRHAEKYIWRGRLDWPEGAASRESIKAVNKLPRLQKLVMQHVDHSAGDLIDLLQGLLKYEPVDRLTVREALRHCCFTRYRRRRSHSYSSFEFELRFMFIQFSL